MNTNHKNEFLLASDLLAREMKDPEFRRLYEALEPEYAAIQASIDARIKAKKLKEQRAKGLRQAQFAT